MAERAKPRSIAAMRQQIGSRVDPIVQAATSQAAAATRAVAAMKKREAELETSIARFKDKHLKETREKVARLERQLAPAAQAPAQTVEAVPRRSNGPFIAASVGLGTGLAVTLTGFGLLGATASLARSIEQESRTATDLQAVLERRDRLESASIALLIIGPVAIVGSAVAVWKLRRR